MLIVTAILALADNYYAAALSLVVAITMLSTNQIDNFFAVRRFRRMPLFGSEQIVQMTEQGFKSHSDFEKADIKWNSFSKAEIFPDGVLLYRGKIMVNWIPYRSLEGENAADRIRALIAQVGLT